MKAPFHLSAGCETGKKLGVEKMIDFKDVKVSDNARRTNQGPSVIGSWIYGRDLSGRVCGGVQ